MTDSDRPAVTCHGPDGPTTGPPAAVPGQRDEARARAGDGADDGDGMESADACESGEGAAADDDTAARLPAGDEDTAAARPIGPERLPPQGHADVQIVAASPGVARRVADALRLRFAASEQLSYPAGDESGGTMLHLTVDTVHLPQTAGPFQLRLVGGRSTTVDAVAEPERPAARKRASAESRRRPPHPPTPDAPSGDRPTP